jgi:tagatose 1,6-diphosphate aldolase GatY/KbaY
MLDHGTAVLRDAHAEGWAIGAFSVYNLEGAQAVCAAAELEQAPVILQAGSNAFAYAGLRALAGLALGAAADSRARVGVHLDHARELAEIRACLELGYSSVMVDGSALPFEDNVRLTRTVVEAAHAAGAWVEGELAGIAGDEDRSADTAIGVGALTDPAAAEAFVARTGVDALAVAIGNVHGITATPVTLDFDRLAAIGDRLDVPLVLHGASGLPDAQLAQAVALGVAKVNLNTELRRALKHALLALGAAPPDGDSMAELLAPARDAITDVARQKIRALRQPRPVDLPPTRAAHA